MPFVKGGELYKVLKHYRNFEESAVKFFVAQIVMGIGVLHRQGIMHRDLKMENLMLDSVGYIKIIDFGLAKVLQNN